jgi:hypothetical protein
LSKSDLDRDFEEHIRQIESVGYRMVSDKPSERRLFRLEKDNQPIEGNPKWRTMPEMLGFLEGFWLGYAVASEHQRLRDGD